jgi:hypothetical protein
MCHLIQNFHPSNGPTEIPGHTLNDVAHEGFPYFAAAASLDFHVPSCATSKTCGPTFPSTPPCAKDTVRLIAVETRMIKIETRMIKTRMIKIRMIKIY